MSSPAHHIGRLHVITDETLQDGHTHEELARLAAEGGADTVQFREKRQRTTRQLIDTARAIRQALDRSPVRLIVDDRVDVALAAEAAGVHLGRNDLDPWLARKMLGTDYLLGGTANSLEEAREVAGLPVDYLGVGPVFGTTTKADPAPGLGLEGLRRIVAAVEKPVVAIGSITADRVAEVLDTGAHGIAVVSAVVTDPSPAGAATRFRRAIDDWVRAHPKEDA